MVVFALEVKDWKQEKEMGRNEKGGLFNPMSNLKVKINRGFKRERENKNRGVWFWKVGGGGVSTLAIS